MTLASTSPTQDLQAQAVVNVMRYTQTATATKFPIDGTREVVVQTLCVETARKAVEGRR